MYIKGKISNGEENISEIEEVWEACGVKDREYQYRPAVYVIAYCVEEESRPVAVGRIQYDGDEYRIGGIYVKEEAVDSGYETFVIKMLLYYAFKQGAEKVYAVFDHRITKYYLSEGFEEESKREQKKESDSNQEIRLFIDKNKQKHCKCTEM